jgi:hypothetical protein
MPIKVYVQTTDTSKRVIDKINSYFSFIKAVSSDGMPIKGNNDSKERIRICMQEGDQFEDIKKHYSYKLVLEYKPTTIPCTDIGRVRFSVFNKL